MLDFRNLTELGIQMTLVLMTWSALSARFLKPLNSLLFYGKTQKIQPSPSNPSFFESLTSKIPFWNVPKSYFTYFYILSSTLAATNIILFCISQQTTFSGVGRTQMIISLTCVFAHNFRRLYECRYIQFKKISSESKPATIQLPHFIVGIVFYIIVNSIYFLGLVNNRKLSTQVTPIKFFASLLLFVVSSYVQFICHVHLSRLIKYSLPSSPSDVPFASKIYEKIACPHYFAEIMIYVSLWGMFPRNRVYPLTWLLLILWVTSNLSISAEQTLHYYQKNAKEGLFGDKKSKVPRNAIFPALL